MSEQTTKPATITDDMIQSVAEAYLYTREHYTDGRSYPVYIMIDRDGDAEAVTFQQYDGIMADAEDGDFLGSIQVTERPLWGDMDDGADVIDLDMYVEAVRDDLRAEIADALAE